MRTENEVEANGRTYNPASNCAVVICLDGCEPEYLDIAISEGLMPNLKRIRAEGTDALAHSVIPSFTNPNNMSIATGRPPAVHGICGNFLFDPDTGEEVMMNDVRFLRAPTLFSKYYKLEHSSPELITKAAFGLPEFFAEEIRASKLVANPGCYSTGALLGILPLADIIQSLERPPIIDAKSGVSGAGGRVDNDTVDYVKVNENFKAYRVFNHQHQPEIQQYLSELSNYSKDDIGEVILEPDYKQTFKSLEETYAKVSSFASKYHLGDEVRTIQEKPIKHYELNKGMWEGHNMEKK